MTQQDIINGLKHTAQDHPCCALTIKEAIILIEAQAERLNTLQSPLRIHQSKPKPPYIPLRYHVKPYGHRSL